MVKTQSITYSIDLEFDYQEVCMASEGLPARQLGLSKYFREIAIRKNVQCSTADAMVSRVDPLISSTSIHTLNPTDLSFSFT